ncbi:hypothetical protein MD484_g8169, partial [Candolleomyces efflorescens]
MPYVSPFIDPAQYISKVNKLSTEGITIDEWIGRIVREAADLSASDFTLVSEIKKSLDEYSATWTQPLLDSRDAASSLAGWLNRYEQVYLDMINMISTEQDAKDVVTEFNAYLDGQYPTKQYDLTAVPGPKGAFEEIEGFVTEDGQHIIAVLQGADWKQGVEELKKTLPQVQAGVKQVRGALADYATKITASAA